MDATPPKAIFCPAPLQSRNLLIWGDDKSLQAMAEEAARLDWATTRGLLGGQTPFLMLLPPKSLSDHQVCELLAQINAHKFGNLNGGFGEIDAAPTGDNS